MKSTIVIGNDLEALLAIHAATLLGHQIAWFADEALTPKWERPTDLLTLPIPGVATRGRGMVVEERGERKGILAKLGAPAIKPEEYMEAEGRWDWAAPAVYEELSTAYGKLAIIGEPMGPEKIAKMVADIEKVNVVCALPAQEICTNEEHFFGHVETAAMRLGGSGSDPTEIIYAADPTVPWFKEVRTPSGRWRHYGPATIPPVKTLARIDVPVKTTCDCYMDGGPIFRIGKYGRWDWAEPLHMAFFRTLTWLQSRQ